MKRVFKALKQKQSFESSSSSSPRPKLSLASPITRLVASQIGKGALHTFSNKLLLRLRKKQGTRM